MENAVDCQGQILADRVGVADRQNSVEICEKKKPPFSYSLKCWGRQVRIKWFVIQRLRKLTMKFSDQTRPLKVMGKGM